MTTSIQSIDSDNSALLVNSVEALRFGPGGVRSLNSGQIAGHRRRNVNGDCTIAQTGTSFVAVPSGTWTLDGYAWGQSSEAVVTISQQADAPADNEFQYSIRTAVTTADTTIAAGQFGILMVKVEGHDVLDFIGKPFVLGFRVRSPKTGIHCVSFRNSIGDRSYITEYTISAANTWETKYVTVPVGLITAGTWNWTTATGLDIGFALASGSTYHTTKDIWQTGNFLATSSQVNCLDTVGNIFAVTGVQLEPGLVPTSFEHRTHASELYHAQRYVYSIAPGAASAPMMSGVIWVANQMYGVVPFPSRMRAIPTLTVNSATDFTILAGGSTWTSTSVALGIGALHASEVQLGFTGGTAGQAGWVRAISSSARMTFSARLP